MFGNLGRPRLEEEPGGYGALHGDYEVTVVRCKMPELCTDGEEAPRAKVQTALDGLTGKLVTAVAAPLWDGMGYDILLFTQD